MFKVGDKAAHKKTRLDDGLNASRIFLLVFLCWKIYGKIFLKRIVRLHWVIRSDLCVDNN